MDRDNIRQHILKEKHDKERLSLDSMLSLDLDRIINQHNPFCHRQKMALVFIIQTTTFAQKKEMS